MHSKGFTVDTSDRDDVVAFWHAVYQASEGYHSRVGWNGNYTGRIGKTSAAFTADVERRLNYFRAMCGVPANAVLNGPSKVVLEPADAFRPSPATRKVSAAQAAALMLIRSYNPSTGSAPGMTHDPRRPLVGWSPAAWNAAAKGNLAFGVYGPGAVTEYMIEELSSGRIVSNWNTNVGHRRWNLFPPATRYASGDQPGESALRPPTNVFYVMQRPGELAKTAGVGFVAYPSAGYFPAPINSRYWSLSRAGADFSRAKVRVTDSRGGSIPVTNLKRGGNFGDPALVWQVGGAAASRSVYADTRFQVAVTGIRGAGIPSSHRYRVTLIHPDRVASNLLMKGPATAAPGSSRVYRFVPPAGAEALEVTSFRRLPASWVEDAERVSQGRVIDRTSPVYPLRAAIASFPGFGQLSGAHSFRLTFPTVYDLLARGVPEQSFEIDRLIVPKQGARLSFMYRRGFMTRGSMLVAEFSADEGVSWRRLGPPIRGVSDTRIDLAASTADFSIPRNSRPVRIRFRYYTSPRVPIYTHDAAPTSPTGIFIDDIKVANCDWLAPRKTTRLPGKAKSFTFNSATAGGAMVKGSQWMIAVRPMLGRKWFSHGVFKPVRITAQ